MNFIQHLMNELTAVAVGYIAYPISMYLGKPIAYKLWDDVKALWNTVVAKEQTAVKSVLPNG